MTARRALALVSPASWLLALYRVVTTARQRAWLATEARDFAGSGPRVARAIVSNTVLALLALALVEGRSPVNVGYWWAQTISTVGYGDVPPTTAAGRLVASWYVVSMIPLVLLAGAHFVGLAIPSLHLFSDAEQEEVKGNARDAARGVGAVTYRVVEVEARVAEMAAILDEVAANLGIDPEAHRRPAEHVFTYDVIDDGDDYVEGVLASVDGAPVGPA